MSKCGIGQRSVSYSKFLYIFLKNICVFLDAIFLITIGLVTWKLRTKMKKKKKKKKKKIRKKKIQKKKNKYKSMIQKESSFRLSYTLKNKK